MTAQSPTPSPQSPGAEYILSYIVARTGTQAVCFIHVLSNGPFQVAVSENTCSSLVSISASRLSGVKMVRERLLIGG